MVLLNGIKYACERCIRGHRVSSCTHTDKPLTMIKPKGRPASQCSHCREQRKIKNAHSSCSCGKKGKSPGQHLASCMCHKNSHCTCPTKEKKVHGPGVKKERKASDLMIENENSRNYDRDMFGEEQNLAPTGSGLDSNFLIEDVVVPFETDQGLLDYFAKHQNEVSDDQIQYGSGSLDYKGDLKNEGVLDSKPLHPQQLQGLTHFPKPPSDADLDFVENMFPLFPLVGNSSFDDSKSLPLLPIPYSINPHSNGLSSKLSNDFRTSKAHDDERHFVATRMNSSSTSFGNYQNNTSNVSQASNTAGSNASMVHHPSSTSLSGMAATANGHTQQPRPLKPSSSFNNTGASHLATRPRRPESVLSIASTSSNTSKQNLFELAAPTHHNLPKLSSSGAFPPFHLSENNSTDDFHHTFYDSSGMFNDAQLLSILSDYEDASRAGHGNITPQSSLPSRQPLQSRRKTSLSRSHSQLHHNQGSNSLNKEHPLLPLKSASSTESSPHQSLVVFSPATDQFAHFKHEKGESHLRKVAEELPVAQVGSFDARSTLSASHLSSSPEKSSYITAPNTASGHANYAEYLEIAAVPMFLEFVNPIKREL